MIEPQSSHETPFTDDRQAIEFIARGYRAHQDSFKYARARLRVFHDAYANSSEDALADRWLSDPPHVESEIYFVMLGDTRRSDEIYPPEARRIVGGSPAPGGTMLTRFESTRQIRSRSLEVQSFPDESAHLNRLDRGTIEGFTPFNYGIGPPLDEQLRTWDVEYVGEVDLDGQEVFQLRVSHGTEPKRQTDTMWVDPHYGFLPIKVETRYPVPNLRSVTVADDLRACSENRWVAGRVRQVALMKTKNPPAPYRVFGWDLLEFDADQEPSPDMLRIPVAPNTWISNVLIPGHRGFRTTSAYIDLNDFNEDGSLKPGVSAYKEDSLPPGVVITTPTNPDTSRWPFDPSNNRWWLWFWGVIAVTFLVAALCLYLRQRLRPRG